MAFHTESSILLIDSLQKRSYLVFLHDTFNDFAFNNMYRVYGFMHYIKNVELRIPYTCFIHFRARVLYCFITKATLSVTFVLFSPLEYIHVLTYMKNKQYKRVFGSLKYNKYCSTFTTNIESLLIYSMID